MRFTPTPLEGAWLVDLDRIEDERGFFARSWSPEEFAAYGLSTDLAACNVSFNAAAGTLRGMHFQADPHGEVKLVRCTAGAIFDVLVDLRPGSPTHRRWTGAVLSAENRSALYIPEGFGHGFQTLVPDSEVLYLMSSPYVAEAARGVRWDDPAFGIDWPPAEHRVMSERDRTYPDYAPEAAR
ncbi:MAG: dTDP-4-dehydrorhamnose 3,5-epimerase [Thermoleophilia bacterium]|nr:dTDP-4-dehydrorhamnose 3,5-epimerase [Thermoleophilia bacterium]